MSESTPGQIVTFYSYKGGTGRTMALANVAWILAANGKRVLVVDWDLESPGLHRFFRPFIAPERIKGSSGVIDMIKHYEDQTIRNAERPADWVKQYAKVGNHAFSLQWSFPDGGTLDFLSAGRHNSDYAVAVGGLDWDNFYDRLNGGQFLDALRHDMRRQYDYTLIDSRTGLSDIADICTIHLPDVLVDCFTFSEQGIEGSAQVAKVVQDKYGARNIRILPVPMRVELAENSKAAASRIVAMRRFAGLPAGMNSADRQRYWASVEVPHLARYAYEETLATFADDPALPVTLLRSFEAITRYITNGDVTHLPEMDAALRQRITEQFVRRAEPAEDEIILRYAPEDEVWAEWLEGLLGGVGVRVLYASPPEGSANQRLSVPRTLTIVSSVDSAREAGILPAAGGPNDVEPMAVYVTDIRPLPDFALKRSAMISGVSAQVAAERILRLIGHTPGDGGATPGARYPGEEPRIFNVIARNPKFTGRDSGLRELRTQLRARGFTVVLPVALQGLGGVGKTQLALEYAHRFRLAYDIVWWIPADPPQFIDTSLSTLAGRMGLETVDLDQLENARRALRELTRIGQKDRWLLIFDNAEELEKVRHLLPESGYGHILITSRNNEWTHRTNHIEVSVFEREESIAHLRQRVATISDDEAVQIAEELGNLPIAVAAAGALLADTGMPVTDYLALLAQRNSGVGEPWEKVWDLSLERLETQSKAAYRMLQLCSVLAADIALELLYSDEMAHVLLEADPSVADKIVRATLVQHINRLALLKLDVQANQVHVHRLLQKVLRDRMTPDELVTARHRVHIALAASSPRRGEVDDPVTWPRFQMLWPHLIVSEAITCDDEKVRQLLNDRVRYLWLRNDLDQAEQLCRQIVDTWTTMLEDDPTLHGDPALRRQLLHLRFNLANILRTRARYAEATQLDQEVLAEQTELLGKDHPHVLMTSGSLAADLRTLGDYAGALKMDKVTYPALVMIFGEDHPRTLSAGNNLATSYRLVGDYRTARDHDEVVHARRRVVLGPTHHYTLHSASCLGRDYRDAGDYEKSVTILRAVYEQLVQDRGPERLETTVAQVNLAVSMRSIGKAAEAASLLDRAYERIYSLLGNSHPETLACQLSRALALLAQGEELRAEREVRTVMAAYAATLGNSHPHTLICQSNLSAIMRALGDRTAAREFAQQATERLSDVLGHEHPFTLGATVNLAISLAESDDLEQAATISADALERLRAALGPEHPDTLRCEANLALIRQRRGEPAVDSGQPSAIRRLADLIGDRHPTVVALGEGKYAHRVTDPHPF